MFSEVILGRPEPVAPSEQEGAFIAPVYILAPEGASQQFGGQVHTINEILARVWYLHDWTKNELETASDNRFHPEIFDRITPGSHFVCDMCAALTTWPKAQREVEQLLEQFPLSDEIRMSQAGAIPRTMVVNNEEELEVIAEKVQSGLHDAGNAISMARRYAEERRTKKNRGHLQATLTDFTQRITSLKENLLDEYPRQEIELSIIVTNACAKLNMVLVLHGIDVVPSWEMPEGVTLWSISWFNALMHNIAQNSLRAFANAPIALRKMVALSAQEVVFPDGTDAVDILFEDNGPGFPEEILTYGFQTGLTQWDDPTIPGTGVGMAYHTKVLRERYGGDLIPEQRTDEQGNIIPGARLRLRLPVMKR